MPNHYGNSRQRPTTGRVVRDRQQASGSIPGNSRKTQAPARNDPGPKRPEQDARVRTVNPERPQQ